MREIQGGKTKVLGTARLVPSSFSTRLTTPFLRTAAHRSYSVKEKMAAAGLSNASWKEASSSAVHCA